MKNIYNGINSRSEVCYYLYYDDVGGRGLPIKILCQWLRRLQALVH